MKEFENTQDSSSPPGLFDEPAMAADEPPEDFVLFDLKRGNFVIWQTMTMTEAVEWTLRLKKAFCRNLQWQKSCAEDQAARLLRQAQKSDNTGSEIVQRTRAYVIRRN